MDFGEATENFVAGAVQNQIIVVYKGDGKLSIKVTITCDEKDCEKEIELDNIKGFAVDFDVNRQGISYFNNTLHFCKKCFDDRFTIKDRKLYLK
jgi:hypothetical protein